MRIDGARALVIGANGGIGSRLSDQLLARGAAHVTDGAFGRSDRTASRRRTVIGLDVTSRTSVREAVEAADDVDLVINAAGIYLGRADDVEEAVDLTRRELEINTLGMLRVARSFAPGLVARRGRLVNLLSITALVANPAHAGYGASKAAAWSLTNALRLEFEPQGMGVTSVFLGYTDTAMTAHLSGPKNSPEAVAATILDGIERDEREILCDERSRDIKSRVSSDIESIYAPLLVSAAGGSRP